MLPEDRYLLRIILDSRRNGALPLCGKHLLHKIRVDNIRALHFQAVPPEQSASAKQFLRDSDV
jgi:hypothetical protein